MIIVVAYSLTKGIFDFSGITKSLSNNIGVTGERFIWVALYISFINSLLEEFFFRGFAFLTLKKLTTRKVAYIFSAILFRIPYSHDERVVFYYFIYNNTNWAIHWRTL